MSDVTVVVVSYNSRRDLERSLPHIVGRNELVVVDNASTDGSGEFVRSRFPGVRVVELRENLGYGGACNEGLREARTAFVLFLNPDAWPEGDALGPLVECARRQGLGAVAPQLHDPHGRRQISVMGFPTRWWLGTPAVTSVSMRSPRRPPEEGAVEGFLVGAALLVRRDAVESIGGFDRDFFMFYEEVDLCRRLLDAGWRLGYCPESSFVHVGGTATRRDWPRMYREQLRGHLRYLAKHEGVRVAEQARRHLGRVLRLRRLVARGEQRRAYSDAVTWLSSGTVGSLIEST